LANDKHYLCDKSVSKMNKIVSSVISILVLCLITLSCTKSSNSGYSMTATVTSPTGNVTSFSALANTVLAKDSAGYITITGGTLTPVSAIAMIFSGYSGGKTYALLGADSVVHGFYTTSTSSYVAIAHGQVTINHVTGNTANGTFSFTLVDSTKVTNGVYTASASGF
jgi:hypothetical protein